MPSFSDSRPVRTSLHPTAPHFTFYSAVVRKRSRQANVQSTGSLGSRLWVWASGACSTSARPLSRASHMSRGTGSTWQNSRAVMAPLPLPQKPAVPRGSPTLCSGPHLLQVASQTPPSPEHMTQVHCSMCKLWRHVPALATTPPGHREDGAAQGQQLGPWLLPALPGGLSSPCKAPTSPHSPLSCVVVTLSQSLWSNCFCCKR